MWLALLSDIMTITINYSPKPSPGYKPRKSVTLHNVESVHTMGPNMVQVQMTFNDSDITHDHVVSVVVMPESE